MICVGAQQSAVTPGRGRLAAGGAVVRVSAQLQRLTLFLGESSQRGEVHAVAVVRNHDIRVQAVELACECLEEGSGFLVVFRACVPDLVFGLRSHAADVD